MEKPLMVIFLGPPGAGKGTQVELIRKKLQLEKIATGELLRDRAKKADFIGRKIKQDIDAGKRMATPIALNLWMEKLEYFSGKKDFKGIIFDGLPRRDIEALMLEEALEWYGWEKNKIIIFFDVPKKEVIKRLKMRRICSVCNAIPSGSEINGEKCKKCGGLLVVRADDKSIAATNKRWSWYEKEVLPTVDYFRRRGGLSKINGNKPIEEVHKNILRVIKNAR